MTGERFKYYYRPSTRALFAHDTQTDAMYWRSYDWGWLESGQRNAVFEVPIDRLTVLIKFSPITEKDLV